MKKSNVYTRTGDRGTTSLVGGTRVSKTHERLEAYGAVDELNSYLGLLITYLPEGEEKERVGWIQNKLFCLGAYLATDQDICQLKDGSRITDEDVKILEKEIDIIDFRLPSICEFILPGGTRGASVCHICRTVCRRVERDILRLQNSVQLDVNVITYVNRLSDFLFVLSRKININEKKDEIFWQKSCK